MRQWELVGITDAEPMWSPPEWVDGVDDELEEPEEETRWTFFWSTDTALSFRTVSDAAGDLLGVDPVRCEGRDLLTVFGIEGMNLAILEAHTEALDGREGSFTLEGKSGRVRCRVAPTHAGDGRVIGTFCLAGLEDPGSAPLGRRLTAVVAA
jgi:PAS domain-containing protein